MKTLSVTAFTILCILITALFAQCPITTYQPDILTGTFTITSQTFSSSTPTIHISQAQQIKTYSHLLTKPFSKQPQIATSISDFSAQFSPTLYLSIKPYLVGEGARRLNSLNFAIKTSWKYTVWRRMKFGFIAEQRFDIEVGIYQIQTNVLSSYEQNKQLQLFFPYRSQFRDTPTSLTFVTGFEIGSQQNSTYSSPIEIQQRTLSRNLTGFSLSLTVTSSTLVSELAISYVAFDSRLLNKIAASTLVYEDYQPQSTIVRNAAAAINGDVREIFHGLTGFILIPRQSSDIQFDTKFTSPTKEFFLSSTTSILYLAYSYLALIGNRCTLCEGFPYFHLNSCLSACPVGTFSVNETCIACPPGTNWNGTMCVTFCSAGRSWNPLTQSCQCPIGLIWTGSVCSSCPQGQQFNSRLGQCICVNGNWNGTTCVTCHVSQLWNTLSLKCQCLTGSFWNGSSCTMCTNGRVWDQRSLSCICQPGLIYDGSRCVMCNGGSVWNQSSFSCQCTQGMTWNGSQCITTCPAGQAWHSLRSRCECPIQTNWNGSVCITCSLNQVFNQSNNKCECVTGYRLQPNGSCTISCPQNQFFNGTQCISTCPIGFYHNGTACTSFTPQCPAGTQWSANQCLPKINTCPNGMTWTGFYCISSQPQCNNGYYYWNDTTCVPLSERCPYPLEWRNNMCLPTSNNCPSGSYYNGYFCIFYDECEHNMAWNQTLVKCVCVEGAFWNGMKCIKCDSGMVYSPDGCVCPYGTVFNGSACGLSNEIGCKAVAESSWNGTHCVCLPGYSALEGRCVCFGLQMNGWCNRCHQKPNSFYRNGICVCFEGFIQYNGQCTNQALPLSPLPTTNQAQCPVSNYWQNQLQQCLPCSEGCLSCIDCYKCLQCNIGYVYNPATELCDEVCGDARRFTLQCDDGNNLNGDGCSLDCKVESGYTCLGGSPNSMDKCTQVVPREVEIVQTGQSRLFGKIVLNVRVNYLPVNLTSTLTKCADNCIQLLNTTVSRSSQSPSVRSQYIGGAFNSVSVTIDFRREPIEKFTINLIVNPDIRQKYMPAVFAGNGLSVTVEPMLLTMIVQKDYII